MTPISWLGDDGRWMAQELLSTFASAKEEGDRLLRSVALVPSKGQGGGVEEVSFRARPEVFGGSSARSVRVDCVGIGVGEVDLRGSPPVT